MTALFTRLALHVRSACDEWVERIEDSQTGHRDRRGRKTQKWYEREYEIERRRKKRQAKRREKQKLEGNGGQKQEGKRKESGGGGKEQSKTKKVTAVMTGALGPIEEGGAITTGSDPVEGTVTAEGHEGGSDPRDEYSPMPSEHSVSSTQAQVHSQRAYERSRSKTKSGSVHGAPKDSEDEEASGSSDEESFPENKGDDKTAKAGKAAKKSEAPAGDGKAGSSTGLRGGGVCGIAELDGEDDDEDKWYSSGEEEYHEHEALDDEYATPGKNPQMDGDTVDNQRGDGVKKHAGTEASESTLAQRAAEPANRESQEVANGDRRCDDENKRHNGRDVSTVAMEPAQPEYENAREDKRNPLESKITGEGYKGSLSPSVPDEATIRKLEPYVNGVEQAASKPPSRESRPYSESRGGTRTEDHIAIQPDGKRFDREPRPYDLPEVCERLKVQRPQAPAKPGLSNQPTPSPTDNNQTQPKRHTSKGHAGLPKRNTRTKMASKPTPAGPSEGLPRTRRAGVDPRYFAGAKTADIDAERARYENQCFGQVPRGSRFYRGAGTHRLGEASQGYEWARGVPARGVSKPRGGHAGPSVKVEHTYENFAENFYGGWENPEHARPSQGIPRGSRFRGYGAFDTSTGRNDGSDDDDDDGCGAEDRRYGRPRPTRGRGKCSDLSTEDTCSSSSSSSIYTSLSLSPSPPPRRRRRAKEEPPPVYNSVPSAKTAPLNHYAVLGLTSSATAEEIEKAGKKMRIQTHPDRLLKPDLTEEEVEKVRARSARVGQAHDVLKDPDQRRRYNAEVRDWKKKHGGVLPPEQ